MDVTNADRAAWAATAIGAFSSASNMQGEDSQTKAKDLATNLVHYLRIKCHMSFEEAAAVIHNAVGMAEQEVEEDPDFIDDLPVEREYGVRLFATFRGECDQTVKAFSFEEACAKARLLKHNDFNYSINDNVEGDETLMVYGPDDDDRAETDPWAGEGASLDARPDGEPFSWDACQLVKDLAKLNPVAELLPADDPFLNLINRAKALCTKEE